LAKSSCGSSPLWLQQQKKEEEAFFNSMGLGYYAWGILLAFFFFLAGYI